MFNWTLESNYVELCDSYSFNSKDFGIQFNSYLNLPSSVLLLKNYDRLSFEGGKKPKSLYKFFRKNNQEMNSNNNKIINIFSCIA